MDHSTPPLRLRALAVGGAFLLLACPAPAPRAQGAPPPERFCPGADGCLRAVGGGLKAGIAARSIAPTGWERPRPDYLKRTGDCPEGSPRGSDGQPRCGALRPEVFKDCGHDGRCRGEPTYVAPDAEGTEGVGRPDWFLDCGRDHTCPGDPDYPGPEVEYARRSDRLNWLTFVWVS